MYTFIVCNFLSQDDVLWDQEAQRKLFVQIKNKRVDPWLLIRP